MATKTLPRLKPPDPCLVEDHSAAETERIGGVGSISFAAALNRNPSFRPRFSPLTLPPRQVGTKEGRPAISFTGSEVGACEKRFEFSLVAKFTIGRPSLLEIQKEFQQAWKLSGRASISQIWDGRHVLIILDSEADVRVALSSDLNKIGHAFFRLFRWSPDCNPKKESKIKTIWVRLPGLPLSIYDVSFVEAIVSTFGCFVDVDEKTKACAAVSYARACIELDVTQSIPDSVWVSLPNDKGYWQSIIIESKLLYCNKCRVHGHSLATCRKAKGAKSTKPSSMPQGTKHPSEVTPGDPKAPLVTSNGTKETQVPNEDRDGSLGGPKEVSIQRNNQQEQEWIQATSKSNKRSFKVAKAGPTAADVPSDVTVQPDKHAMVIYSSPEGSTLVDDYSCSKASPGPSEADPGTSMMVVYNESLEDVNVSNPSTLPMSTEFHRPSESDMQDFKNAFERVRHDPALAGYTEFPEEMDEDFVSCFDKALENLQKAHESIEAVPGNVSPPISEWLPGAGKKKKNKEKQVIAPAEPDNFNIRRSSRVRQNTEANNKDFVYPPTKK